MLFPERLKYFRQDKGLNEEQLGEVFGLSSSTIRLYESGKMKVSMEMLEQLAKFFGVSPGLLLGTQYADIPIEEAVQSYRLVQDLVVSRQNEKQAEKDGTAVPPEKKPEFSLRSAKKITRAPIQKQTTANDKMIPVFSKINPDETLFGDKYVEFYWPISDSITREHGSDLRSYFYLRVQGNSMEPTVCDQDIVLVKKQVMVENNEMAVVLSTKDDAWVTRISHGDGKLIMNPDNKKYSAESYSIYDCKVLGKVLWKTGAPKRE